MAAQSKSVASKTRPARKHREPGTSTSQADVEAFRKTCETIGKELAKDNLLRQGYILFHLPGGEGGSFAWQYGPEGVRMTSVQPGANIGEPIAEVWGGARHLDALLRGEKDGRMLFFAGLLRVRGNTFYLSDLGMKLGCLDKPIF